MCPVVTNRRWPWRGGYGAPPHVRPWHQSGWCCLAPAALGKGWPRARLARCRRGKPSLSDRPAPRLAYALAQKKPSGQKFKTAAPCVCIDRAGFAGWPVGEVARGIHCASRTAQIDISFFRPVMHCAQGHARAHAGGLVPCWDLSPLSRGTWPDLLEGGRKGALGKPYPKRQKIAALGLAHAGD